VNETSSAMHAERAIQLGDWYWEELLRLEPILGTDIGDERFDDALPDLSDAGLAERERVNSRALKELATIDRTVLQREERATLDVLEALARRELDRVTLRFDQLRAASHMDGPAQLLAQLGVFQRADTPARTERYVARLRRVPRLLDEFGTLLRESVGGGAIAPAAVLERAISQIEILLATPAQGLPAFRPCAEASDSGRQKVLAALEEAVVPAYARYVESLREYRRQARQEPGLHALGNGEALYAAAIRGQTGLELDPEYIHDLGRTELAQIADERREIAARLGYPSPERAIAAYQTEYTPRLLRSADDLLALARGLVDSSWRAAPHAFGRLPRENCEVCEIEPFRAADSAYAFYEPPGLLSSRLGRYYVNPHNLRAWPLHRLAATTFHEANPGHHFQVAIEHDASQRHKLRRSAASTLITIGFIEGWALYAEGLADEMGLYRDDFDRLGRLDLQLLRTVRLMIDTGLHAFGWSRDRAIEEMQSAGIPRAEAEIEVDRYAALPAQALTYKLGQLEIERWRAALRERAGSAFSLSAFHDRLLDLGSLPLAAMGREVLNDGAVSDV
jgi:uncharacterized protein (DUF885 family)